MSKLRHIAVIVEDPEASAKFFEEASSKNLAEASGSSTMTAMWRSLDICAP